MLPFWTHQMELFPQKCSWPGSLHLSVTRSSLSANQEPEDHLLISSPRPEKKKWKRRPCQHEQLPPSDGKFKIKTYLSALLRLFIFSGKSLKVWACFTSNRFPVVQKLDENGSTYTINDIVTFGRVWTGTFICIVYFTFQIMVRKKKKNETNVSFLLYLFLLSLF